VQLHHELLDNVKFLLNDSNERLIAEKNKIPRNEDRILKLKADIRESVNLLSELGLGTPIVAQIRAKLAEKEARRIIPIQSLNEEQNENEKQQNDKEESEESAANVDNNEDDENDN